ncbi:hypothetical protein [Denitromonas iodatirespirans]|uniref:Uncharacterized protein n=1 Tax=Denitromonas iodatirespirans TaxID=2795389 RepID=A0A944D918_DENI1|nr:hypothetical protein [Denitromonas iodatirespirans]MBT0960253.1 hypothetical protein [Denitromonas iodatirespirans]
MAAAPVWPRPWRVAIGLSLGFAAALAMAAVWGAGFIELLLPVIGKLIVWLDERFAILVLSIDHTSQDTVVRLRVTLTQIVVVGGIPTRPDPKGWLEVTTTTGAMLQPLAIACGLAVGWPGALRMRAARLGIASLAALAFLFVDLPITLHAYIWDMFVDNYEPGRFSPILIWHKAMHDGGRLGAGVLLGAFAIAVAGHAKHRISDMPDDCTQTPAVRASAPE